uniref:Uncharacterized protein MANES_09G003900 n=1 Tax=Rhizophora mucronata TaxID=61149 RepID=A0A2P2PMS8_RHIMU
MDTLGLCCHVMMHNLDMIRRPTAFRQDILGQWKKT